MNEIKNNTPEYAFAGVVLAVFLVLTAWGNAIALVAASVIGLSAGFLIFRGRLRKRGLLAGAIALVLAAAIPIVILLSTG